MELLDWTSIGATLFTIAGTVVSVFLAWFIQEKVGHTKVQKVNTALEKFNNEFLLKQSWAMEGVRYAEQVIKGTGKEKFGAAIEFVGSKLRELQIDVTNQELKVLIEAEVQKLKQNTKDEWNGAGKAVELSGTVIKPDFVAEAEATKKDWNNKF